MKQSELKAHLGQEIANSYTGLSGEVASEIGDAIDYYLGKPFGNEIEGKSQVISRDTLDVIEWILPSLMRVFTSNEKAVCFDPVGPEDEDAAKQETDIVNHVFYKENNGFVNLYTWFKDALLSKNGVLKVFWDPTKEMEREEYHNLTDQEMMYLIQDPDVDPIEHTENADNDHDLVVMRTKNNGCAKVIPVPPEEFLISKETTSIYPKDARFTAHRTLKTRSELIEMGFSKTKVNRLPKWNPGWNDDIKAKRDDNKSTFGEQSEEASMDLIEVHECYYKVDFDGDGVAELRQITYAGQSEILANEECDRNPFIAITPIIITHKFYGLSIADVVKDIQLIKSTLMRGILDNTYLANDGRTAVQDGMVNMDDLLTSRSGGVVRTRGRPMDMIMPMPYNPLPNQTFEVMNMMDSVRKERTGVSSDAMGLESNVLAHGRTGVINEFRDMAGMRTELVARIFAEVGVKELMRELHAILQKHVDRKKTIQIRGKWVEVVPTEWKCRYNMTANVGLGSGNKDRQLQFVNQILAYQSQLLGQAGGRGVTEQNVFNALEKFVEYAGLGAVEQFFTDPSTQPPPQPQPDVELEKARAEIQLLQQQVDTQKAEAETNRQEAIWKHQEAMAKILSEDQTKRYDIELKYKYNVPGGLKNVG